MLRCLITTAFALSLTLASAETTIDFSATPNDYVSQGFAFRELTFKEGENTVTIELPPNWSFRSSPGRLQLVAPLDTFAEGTLHAQALNEPSPLDEVSRRALVQQALNSTPETSDRVGLIDQMENPLLLGGHESYGVTVSFQAMGEEFRRSLILVNFPNHRLFVRFTAPKTQFEALARTFRRAVTSWRVTKQPDRIAMD